MGSLAAYNGMQLEHAHKRIKEQADEIERLRAALRHEQTTCRREGCEPYRLLLQRATDAESSARIERGLRHV